MASGLDLGETGRISASGRHSQLRTVCIKTRKWKATVSCRSPPSFLGPWDDGVQGVGETFLEGNLGSCCGKVLNSG